MVQNHISNNGHSCCPACRHSAAKLRRGSTARIEAEGHWLIPHPPLVALHVLREGRQLHGIEALRTQSFLALSGDVRVVPLPQFDVARAASLTPAEAANGLLISAKRAVHGCAMGQRMTLAATCGRHGTAFADVQLEVASRCLRTGLKAAQPVGEPGAVGGSQSKVRAFEGYFMKLLRCAKDGARCRDGAVGSGCHVPALPALQRDGAIFIAEDSQRKSCHSIFFQDEFSIPPSGHETVLARQEGASS